MVKKPPFYSRKATAISSKNNRPRKQIIKKRLTSIFDLCLYFKLARHTRRDFFGDNLMIRRSEYTFATLAAATGRIGTRQSLVWNAAMCTGLDNLNYQPKTNGSGRSQQLD